MKEVTKKDFLSPKYILLAVLAVLTVLTWVFNNQIYGEDSVFNSNPFGNDALNSIYQRIPAVFRTVTVFFLAWVVNFVLQVILSAVAKGSKQMVTAVKLVQSLLKYIIFIAAIMISLNAWGVDTTTLVASAGILSLIIGLGAQSLIADIIAGLFMVFENDFEVGDIVVIDGWRGTVTEIGMRTTKLLDTGGNIKIINNSKISSVINQTKRLSFAKCTVGIDYGENLPRVELVIKNNLEKIKANIPQIVNGPFYKGVDELADSSVNLVFFAECNEEDIYIVQRALNREVLMMFNENNINIPFPQIVINEPAEFEEVRNTKRLNNEAKAFAAEQSELSKNMEDSQK